MDRQRALRAVAIGLGVALSLAAVGQAAERVVGPATVDLGSNVAQIRLGKDFVFLDGEATRKAMQQMGNTVDNTEVGLVSPQAEDQDWFIVFEYKPEGYVKDEDKDKIDKDAILKSYQEGTEEANKARKEKGIPGLHVTGWYEEPHYDSATHNLVWALRAKSDDGGEVVNYNVRLLGREGFMSVTLVDDPSKIAYSKPQVETILSTFSYQKGKTYAEWVPGDKVAQYGLAALVAGGAGAAAAKLGLFASLGKLLAKGGKAIILGVIALGVGLKKMVARLMGGGDQANA